ncbi:dolichol phosphate-mannose biosynthesis regulatory protein Dpm2 [Protomyces lactucae-debilis]|uniref:Dolichol phosphate-mannose biosynthesis regulatory protein n=1 Tax=Protomyces lactucae-debilis TaxID=2754530 RepID=A0A1Y2F7Q3_PROLT|nr:dolichol phosphate-mannose biosynthesis regulatory protein Dpm2 [Protomyces lactucae-debilis]ORY79950.1 dolichol phosphate-mannose biosynthesis regulatory protein Dpm2 [Protomyces lactucae-debilis]
MASSIDKLIGLLMLFVATFVFVYYTAWVMLMPFVDQGHPLHELFPAREWAIRIPVILLILGGTLVGSFLGMVMVRSSQKKAAKKSK